MGNFLQITPFLHVPDLEAAVTFFTELLGFRVGIQGGGYAYVEREPCGVRILQRRGDDGRPRGNRRYGLYVDVRDVDALHAELAPKLAKLPPGDVDGPADKLHGQRELLIVAPDGSVIAFGHALARDAT